MKLYSNVKKSVLLVLIVALLLSVFPLSAIADETYDFDSFTEEEAISFVEACDIDIPVEFLQNEDLASFTLGLILQAYHSPNVPFCFNYNITQSYAEDIRTAVRSYMNLGAVPAIASTTAGYELQYNKVMNQDGEWDVTSGGYYNPKWANYNCYAFAINRAEQPQFYDSGTFIQYQPGDMSGNGYFGSTTTIAQLADLVRDDLDAMGYESISSSPIMPTIDDTKELICVRRASSYDYHFMRYDLETNAWYHKPGSTAILKYNYTPSGDTPWYMEYSMEYEWIISQGIEEFYCYDSDIMFITYSKNQINVDCCEEIASAYIEPNKDTFWELNFAVTGVYDIFLASFYEFDYEIYDEDFDIISSGMGEAGAAVYLNLYFNNGKYYLRMSFESNEHTTSHSIDISIEHSHELGNFVYRGIRFHACSCVCGLEITGAHYVDADDIVDGRYATCFGCNHLLDLQRDFANVIMSITQVSVNGSYILPNGIVVLVDADVEAYLAGTLRFYHPEDIPVTQ